MNEHEHKITYTNMQLKCVECAKTFSAEEACRELRITMEDLGLQLDRIGEKLSARIPEPSNPDWWIR